MFAAEPPSMTMPWTWSPGRSCWRSRPRATWETVIASSALTPSHGAAEAWASLPVKVTSKWSTARHGRSRRSLGPGVDHHRGVHVVEEAGVDQVDLAAAALLGGRAEQRHGQVELVGDGGQPDGRAQRGRGDDVVAAGVAHVGQRVVLGAEAPRAAIRTRAVARNAVGRPATPRSTSKPAGLGGGGDRLGALELLVAQLGVGVHEVAELDEVAAGVAHGPGRASPGLIRSTATTSPALTESPGVDVDAHDHAARSAFTEFSIFIASRMTIGLAGLDLLAHRDDHLDDRALHGHRDLARAAAHDAGVVLAARLGRGARGRPRPSSPGSGIHSATVTRRPLTSAVTSLRTRPSPTDTTGWRTRGQAREVEGLLDPVGRVGAR